jgi:hypothetical protein
MAPFGDELAHDLLRATELEKAKRVHPCFLLGSQSGEAIIG